MSLHQVYAYLTEQTWQRYASSIFPHAVSVVGYRLCVFTNQDSYLKSLADEHDLPVAYLSSDRAIASMEANDNSVFVCDFDTAKAIKEHFVPNDAA
ncbi:hypothetical protein ACQ9QQ_001199 [Vibrio cholerae]